MRPLFSSWPAVRKQLEAAAQLALFLDYDGTLTPIVTHPSGARLPEKSLRLLSALNRQPGIWVAIVSGRSLKEIRQMVGLEELCYVGNHGLEVRGPKLQHVNPMARRSRPVLVEISRLLEKGMRTIPGAWVEDKGLTLTVHFRLVSPEQKLQVRNLFHEILRPYREGKKVRVTGGKEIFEVRPPVHWTKGAMVLWLLARRRALGRSGAVLPVYVGDDVTDEDAFEALGGRGITVVVGRSNPLSRARYSVSSPEQTIRFLERLLETRGKKSGAV